ncbi:MAG: lysophospholipid acyltransferase family protein [Candidatus Omnitrophota bacterium]
MQPQDKKITIKYRIEYMFFIAFVAMLKLSPLAIAPLYRKMLRFIYRKYAKRYHRVVDKNLHIVFPHETEENLTRLKEKIYRHFSAIMVEIIYMFVKKSSTATKILKPIEIRGLHLLENALAKQSGVILFSAHFGNWELVPYILGRKLDCPINSIAREMNNPLVEQKVKRFREYMGSAVIYKQHSLRTMLSRLKDNGIVYLLIDHHAVAREAVTVEFFGRDAGAVPIVAQLHLKKAIPALPVFLHYETDKIVLEILDEIRMDRTEAVEQDIVRLSRECLTIIEEKIKQYPEQWFWFHDRWKIGAHSKGSVGNVEKGEI